MTKNRLLAEVFWEAANERLWDGISEYDSTADHARLDALSTPRKYSCDAVFSVLGLREDAASHFIHALGCDTYTVNALSDYESGEERQGVRYMWLLLAMHVAEDEGIEL